ncbi:MAG TPA: hypothetical protein VFJ97_11270 [Dermatophilaceae bacterium]|nr:hypothetical protein [Dermatophilaceae bacterium]
MHRGVAVVLALTVSGVAPAAAQTGTYGPGPTTSAPAYGPSYGPRGTTPPPSGCGRGAAELAAPAVPAGGRLVVSTPPGSLGSEGVRVTLALVRSPVEVLLGSPPLAADRSLRADLAVPATVGAGVYVLAVQGVDPAGRPKALLAPVAVTGRSGAGRAASSRPPGLTACSASVHATFAADRDAAVVRDVASGHASLVLDGDVLRVVGRHRAGRRLQPWAALGAAACVAGLLVLYRRRRRA